ncbi:hypothetical protein [Janthinobacterium sp. BJB426]|uniref:hypothetical protein n=1 Tax=Janthinobacterium sp. BJB426 TaxID=2048010 RepID=UPI0013052170|nr:hypothetical protein [Janthinobacterium sp. BJB426]
MRPIQIYLDSSDFSDLSNIQNKTPEYKSVLDYLVAMKSRGLINIRFSEAHVVEAAPTSPAAIPLATGRFNMIKQLCGRNSLIHPIDVIEAEVSRDSTGVHRQVIVQRNDGTWMPALVNVSELFPDVEQLAADDIKKCGREERRKYIRNGKPTTRWYAKIREANLGEWNMATNLLPLDTAAVRIVKKYFIGEVSRNDALRALNKSITDVEVFGRWYTKDWSSASAMSQHLREIGAEFKKALCEARRQFENLMQNHTAIGEDPKKFLNLSMRTFYEVLADSSVQVARDIAESIGAISKPIENPWRDAPGLTCALTLAMHVARRSVVSQQPRESKESDFPDAYHAIYLPYVDVFRADGFTASMLRECKLPFPTVIVEKLLHLPAQIDEILKQRACDVGRISG